MTEEEQEMLRKTVEKNQTVIDGKIEKANEQAKNAGKIAEETKNEIANLLIAHKELVTSKEQLQKNFDDLEVTVKKYRDKGASPKKSFEKALYDKFNGLKGDGGISKGTFDLYPISTKADLSISDALTGDVIEPARNDSQYYFNPERTERVRDVLNIPTVGVTSNTFEFTKETNFTDNTDVVAEEGTIPSNDFDLVQTSVTLRKIANSVTVSDELLADLAGFSSYVGMRLGMKIGQDEDTQIIAGSGVGENLSGYITNATAFSGVNNSVEDASNYDVLVASYRQALIANYSPTAFLLNPSEYIGILQKKDGNNNYTWQQNFQMMNGRLHVMGIPIYMSTAIASDNFLLGDFARASAIIDRQSLQIDATDSHASQFLTGQVEIRATKRLALAVYNDASFITGDMADAIAAIDIT